MGEDSGIVKISHSIWIGMRFGVFSECLNPKPLSSSPALPLVQELQVKTISEWWIVLR